MCSEPFNPFAATLWHAPTIADPGERGKEEEGRRWSLPELGGASPDLKRESLKGTMSCRRRPPLQPRPCRARRVPRARSFAPVRVADPLPTLPCSGHGVPHSGRVGHGLYRLQNTRTHMHGLSIAKRDRCYGTDRGLTTMRRQGQACHGEPPFRHHQSQIRQVTSPSRSPCLGELGACDKSPKGDPRLATSLASPEKYAAAAVPAVPGRLAGRGRAEETHHDLAKPAA